MIFWVFHLSGYNLPAETQVKKNNRKQNLTMIKKTKISRVSEFSILPYTQNRKLGNLGKFCFI